MLKVQPRFDLLDEHSTLVPFGLGIVTTRPASVPTRTTEAAPADAANDPASQPALMRRLLEALAQIVLSNFRNFAAK